MRNNALPFTGTTLVLGIFAAFLRWLQNLNIYDEATGLARSGAGISIVLLLYAVACAAAFAALAFVWLRRCDCPAGPEALKSPGLLPVAAAWLCAAVYVACALALLFSVTELSGARLRRIFAAAAIFGGLCFPFLPQRAEGASGINRVSALVLPPVIAFSLVYYYITAVSAEPVLWRVAPTVLALAFAALGFLGVAGFLCGAPRPRFTLLFLQLGAFFSLAVTFDSRPLWQTAMLAAAAVMCLLLEWLIVYNLKEK